MDIIIKSLLKELRNPDEQKFQSVFDNFKNKIKKNNDEGYIKTVLNGLKEVTIQIKRGDSMKKKTPLSPYRHLAIKAPDWPEIQQEVKTDDDDFSERIEKTDFAFTFTYRCNQIIQFCEGYFESISNNNVTNTINKKIKWHGKLNQLAWMFHELKKQPSKEKKKEGYYPFIECTIDELADFIFNNFECGDFSRETIEKYLRDTSQRKNIPFLEKK